jgi:hypothetical protein
MLGKFAGAIVGRKIVGRNRSAKGAVVGYGLAMIAKRGIGPLLATAAVAWGVRKLYRNRGRLIAS